LKITWWDKHARNNFYIRSTLTFFGTRAVITLWVTNCFALHTCNKCIVLCGWILPTVGKLKHNISPCERFLITEIILVNIRRRIALVFNWPCMTSQLRSIINWISVYKSPGKIQARFVLKYLWMKGELIRIGMDLGITQLV